MKTVDYIKQWWHQRSMFVILDASDNSVTLSRALFRHMQQHAPQLTEEGDGARVFVFFIPEEETFGFTAHLPEQPTQTCAVQYNSRYRCIGFESLCPSVVRMYYYYALPLKRRIRLRVIPRQSPAGYIYYQFRHP